MKFNQLYRRLCILGTADTDASRYTCIILWPKQLYPIQRDSLFVSQVRDRLGGHYPLLDLRLVLGVVVLVAAVAVDVHLFHVAPLPLLLPPAAAQELPGPPGGVHQGEHDEQKDAGRAKVKGDDGQDGHVAVGAVEGQVDDDDGDPPVLDGRLDGHGDDLRPAHARQQGKEAAEAVAKEAEGGPGHLDKKCL